jgi:hypothetical protein
MAWRDQSSPCLQDKAPVFRLPRGASFAQAIGCLLGPAEEGWICICTSTDRASTDTFRPPRDILALGFFFLLCPPMLFFPPSSSSVKGGTSIKYLHSKYSGVITTSLYFPSVRDKAPLPFLQAHLSIHCGHKDEEVLAFRLWQSPVVAGYGLGEANDTLLEGRLQITWLMGHVGVTKGGGEEVRREKSKVSRQTGGCV